MAIVQISRIQHRRGLQQDLPQLASAELGWSIDQRKLYIGNGTLEEGAPTEGVTQILTEFSDISSFLTTYLFKGTESGYVSQTSTSPLTPVYRSIQNVLDEWVSVKDFGAKGDGTTDDTAAIDWAIRQIYVRTLNNTAPAVRRTLRFPAGKYKISSNIVIPPNATIVGEGKNNTIIEGTTSTVFLTCDSLFQTAGAVGTNGAVLPSNIVVSGMTLRNTSSTNAAFYTLNASAVLVDNCTISGNAAITGTGTAIKITNSTITGAVTPVTVGTSITGFVSENNYYPDATSFPISGLTSDKYSVADTFGNATIDAHGIYSGSAKFGTGRSVTLSVGTTAIATLANGSATFDYEITSGTNYRFGTFKYNRSAGTCTFDDEFTEPAASIGANLYAGSNGALSCTVTSAATLKYTIKKFI